jgi:hypothetical protein
MGLATIPHKIWEELAKLPEDYRPLSLIIPCQKKTPHLFKGKNAKVTIFLGGKKSYVVIFRQWLRIGHQNQAGF